MIKYIKNKYTLATILTIVIYLVYLWLMNIYPFSEYSILKSDMFQQYANFFCYLKQVLINGKSLFFSWNLGLANNFYTTFAYYLASPLNLGVIFFKNTEIDIFIEILTLIKIILISNFTILYLEKSYKCNSAITVIFGLMFAYSSYVMCYSFHIMWLDCVYMLPIVLLFTDKYIENGKIWPFTVALTYSILTNYYIGYIVVLYSGIYFLAKLYILKPKLKEAGKKIIKFILNIAISFGIGMIVIWPSLEQLSGKISTEIKLIEIDIEKIKLLFNVIFNNYVYMFTQKSCFIFSSTFVVLLLPMYYLNKNISQREKRTFTVIIIFLLLPIISPFFYKMWHAFTNPNGFHYRYSFTLIFTLIIMAFRTFQKKR